MTDRQKESLKFWCSIITAIAALITVFASIFIYFGQKSIDEQIRKNGAVLAWTQGHNSVAGHCIKMLSVFSAPVFGEFAADREGGRTLHIKQKPFLEKCFAQYQHEDKRDLLASNYPLTITDEQRDYLVNRVGDHLNAYDVLADTWTTLGDDLKVEVCRTLPLKGDRTYSDFREIARGTNWWNVHQFSKLIDGCGDGRH